MPTDALERVLDRLERVKKEGGQHLASCPVTGHGRGNGDRNPSLTISHENGRVLLHCHTGCHPQDVLIALGLDWPDLFDEPITSERGVKVGEWVYQAPDGSPYLTVERWHHAQGKRFIQRIPGADRAGLGGGFKPIPFKLPKVLAAAKAGEEVYVVEGEKCVSAAEHLGVVATTAPQGVAGWRDYYSKYLQGCSRVTIVCDNDEPGMRYAASVAASLKGAGIPIRTVRVGVATDKADLYDHVIAGLGLDDLVPVRLNRLRPEGVSARALLANTYKPVQWAVKGILPTGFAILGGPPKLGKSMMVLDVSLGVAAGGLAMNTLRCEQGSVLYLSLDNDSERRLQYRMRMMLEGQGLDPALLPIEFHTEWPTGDAAIKAAQEWANDERDDGRRPLLVVVDTLSKAEPQFEGRGNGENSYLASTTNLSRWSRFAGDNDLALLAVHHDKKGEEPDWVNRFTGSRGLTATAQTLMMLDVKRGEESGYLRVAGRDIGTEDYELRKCGLMWGCVDVPVIEEEGPRLAIVKDD